MTESFRRPCGEQRLSLETAVCPKCGRIEAELRTANEVHSAQRSETDATGELPGRAARRMFEALLDPRSIRWLLLLGGSLAVLGLIVWLVSVGVFENPLNQAFGFAVGTLALFIAGWWLSLRTRFTLAGEAVTFLGTVVAPLNLWLYDAQELLTVDGHLWVGGLVCCLLYGATLAVLRKPIFLYAMQTGTTLTGLLLLADLKSLGVMDVAVLLGSFGLIAIHLERALPVVGEFDRRRFGRPLLWTGLAQLGGACAMLLPLQLAGWMELPLGRLSWLIDATRLDVSPMVAAAIWLVAAYAALYSAMVPRLAGGWLLLAAGGCWLMAESTVLINSDASAEGAVIVLALTAALACLAASKLVERNAVPRAGALGSVLILSCLPLFMGYLLFARGVMPSFAEFGWARPMGGSYPLSMALTAACFAASAAALRPYFRYAAALRFLTAGAVLLATAGSVRLVEMPWSIGAAILTLIPLAYLIEGILRKDDVDVSIAYTAFGMFSASAFLAVCHQGLALFIPHVGKLSTLGTAIVALEATAFLLMAACRLERAGRAQLAASVAVCSTGTMLACLWQGLGYAGAVAGSTVPAFVMAAACLTAISRACGTRSLARPALISGATLLLATAVTSHFRAFGLLFADHLEWRHAVELASIVLAALAMAAFTPRQHWRRAFLITAAISAASTVLTVVTIADLSGWQKLEACCVACGVMLLAAGHVSRFQESTRRDDTVDVALWSGAMLAIAPQAIAMLYHRIELSSPSLVDELILMTIGVLMLASGLSWRLKATTIVGGIASGGYLIVLMASLLRRPEVTMGAYLTGAGLALFAAGIALSIYREQILALPDRITKRQGVFQVLDWR